jgi:Fur family ferric uptake transcriptional regulator
VEEFVDPAIEKQQHAIAAKLEFELRDHSMILYGHCRRKGCPSKPEK